MWYVPSCDASADCVGCSGPHHGHYVAIVKGPHSWLIFDDDKIEAIKECEIPRYFGDATSGSAYVLYYQAVDLDPVSLGIKVPAASKSTGARNDASHLTTSASSSATEDDSPLNPLRDGREHKKRSKSSRHAKERVSGKVQVSDFEVMRVLGKGCAGKVLLVRHKSSSDLYALKAFSKRHVLANQELQHTLTEQAVLRRMAAEGTDPFVVKLWWSFHDKENLFLVMVRLACK